MVSFDTTHASNLDRYLKQGIHIVNVSRNVW